MSEKQRKVVIFGYRSVGKSSLSIQFVDQQFVDSYDPTIEDTFTTVLNVHGRKYHLSIVDTAGQDEYDIMPPHNTMDGHGYILVYSINSRKSYDVLPYIRSRLLDLTGQVSVPIILVGNKTDLHAERVVSQEEGRRLAQSWNVLFLEASAKRNESVREIFTMLLEEIERMDGTPATKSSCGVQ